MQVVKDSNQNSVDLALKFLRLNKAIAFASDTVYGLAVDASSKDAVAELYSLKNRDQKNPIAIFVKNLAMAKKIFVFDELSEKIAQKFYDKGLTLVLEVQQNPEVKLAENLNQNADNFLGFRIVENYFLQKLFEKFDGILAVTSANISGQSPATDILMIEKYFANFDILAIDCGPTKSSTPSTVVKICNQKLSVIRVGAIKESELYDN